jgi:hypothetical protein
MELLTWMLVGIAAFHFIVRFSVALIARKERAKLSARLPR